MYGGNRLGRPHRVYFSVNPLNNICMYVCMNICICMYAYINKKRVQQTFLFGDWKGDGLFSNAESVISFRKGKCGFAAVSLF